MDRFGWVPSFGGNISARLDGRSIAITRSGGRKGFLGRDNIIAVDLEGRPLNAGDRPSAETLLHCHVYRDLPEVGAVLHGHSVAATVLSRLVTGPAITLAGYEMIKAFEIHHTHDVRVSVPVFENSQDMERLVHDIGPELPRHIPGYILRGHGAYAWGRTVDNAMANLEALEFLLQCELETLKVRGLSAA
ncbi:methylthioribulose 1-phosphate dehydratase [Acetobacteraceae bacterium KSS12]|uniref:Methylthioribulose-1-phosphate dehydratase n=2 Tax=Rhizosaccharibacter radicis TaxID=2782605 RepID=A0ABT1W3F1_9PROT|nr:methylthioribulose 1-phosphate dehydratase [Acetobacteraceae bacterium KSS12]